MSTNELSEVRGAAQSDPDSAAQHARTGYLGSLDTLRGVGMVLVLFAHLTGDSSIRIGHLTGTWLGVSMFFTLSGFLICRQLLVSWGSLGHLDLAGFWKRRANRLLPAVFACVTLVLVCTALGWLPEPPGFRHEVVATLLYSNNWYRIRRWTAGSFGQFWSLSIEEQFYLVFPLTFIVLTRKFGRNARWFYAALALAGLGYTAIIVKPNYIAEVYLSSQTRFAEILVGVVLAYVTLSPRYLRLLRQRWFVRASQVAGVLAIVGFAILWSSKSVSDPSAYRLPLWINAACSCGYIGCALTRGIVTRLLEVRPLMWLGRISYSAYVYHVQLNALLTSEHLHVFNTAELATIRLSVTIIVSGLSYHFLERPFRRQRNITTPKAVTMYGSVAAVLIVAAMFMPLPKAKYHRPLTTLGAGGFGEMDRDSNSSSFRIVLYGDQLAMSSISGLRAAVAPLKATDWVSARIAENCPIAGVSTQAIDGVVVEPTRACLAATFLAPGLLESDGAQQLIVQGGIANLADRRLPDGAWAHLGTAELDALELQHLRSFAALLTQKPAQRVDWFLLNPDQAVAEFHAYERSALAANAAATTTSTSTTVPSAPPGSVKGSSAPLPPAPTDAQIRSRALRFNELVREAVAGIRMLRLHNSAGPDGLDANAWRQLLPQ